LIDIWEVATFDEALLEELRDQADLIRSYKDTAWALFLERETSHLWVPPSTNPHADEFLTYVEFIGRVMEERIIRAWHYSRMTDDEVLAARRDGVYPLTLETLRQRLDAHVVAKSLSQKVADALYTASRMHGEPQRADKFWMVSHPLPPDDAGVEPLLREWGGESVNFSNEAEAFEALLIAIGAPRILEIAVPIRVTRQAHLAARAVVAAFAQTLGCHSPPQPFDLYLTEPLPGSAVLNVHAEGDATFGDVLARAAQIPT
jgi:hypothetical protein